MSYKRAVMFAVGMYVASFIIGVAASLFLGPDVAALDQVSATFIALQVLISIALGFAGAWFYFASSSTMPSARNGLYFGGVAVVIGFILDFLLFIPGILAGYTVADLASFYMEPWFWIALVLILGSTTYAGHLRTRPHGDIGVGTAA